jgi:hypothetical protein
LIRITAIPIFFLVINSDLILYYYNLNTYKQSHCSFLVFSDILHNNPKTILLIHLHEKDCKGNQGMKANVIIASVVQTCETAAMMTELVAHLREVVEVEQPY